MSDIAEVRSVVKVWNDEQETRVLVDYDRDEAPDDIGERLEWERAKAMEMVEFEATGAKVKETYSWDNYTGCYV